MVACLADTPADPWRAVHHATTGWRTIWHFGRQFAWEPSIHVREKVVGGFSAEPYKHGEGLHLLVYFSASAKLDDLG